MTVAELGEAKPQLGSRRDDSDFRQAPLEKRYDAFCKEAENLLELAGLSREDQEPRIVDRGFYQACVNLASIHFPNDKKIGGDGPRGMLYQMHISFGADKEQEGALIVAQILKQIIKYRPILDQAKKKSGAPIFPTRSHTTSRSMKTAGSMIQEMISYLF